MPFWQKLSTDSRSSHLLWAEDKCSVTWLWFRQAWSFLFALHLATLSLVFSRRSRTLNTIRSSNKMLNISVSSTYKSTHKICQKRLRQRFLQFPAPVEVSAPQLIPAELIFFIKAEIFSPRPDSLAGQDTRGCSYSRRDQAGQLWQSIWEYIHKNIQSGSSIVINYINYKWFIHIYDRVGWLDEQIDHQTLEPINDIFFFKGQHFPLYFR